MKCSATIFGDRVQSWPCSRKGTVERKKKWYCRQHDPVQKEKRAAAQMAKWNAKYADREAKHAAADERLREEGRVEARKEIQHAASQWAQVQGMRDEIEALRDSVNQDHWKRVLLNKLLALIEAPPSKETE